MSIHEILRSGTNVTLAISANDLREWHKEVISDTRKELEKHIIDEKTETYLSAQQTCEKLGINDTTLWRWKKKSYLVPAMAGGKRRYKMSDVKLILEGEK